MGKHEKPRQHLDVPCSNNNTVEKIQHKQLSQVDALVQLLLDANAPAIGVDVAGRVTVWSKRLVDITGFDAKQVLGRSISDFVYGVQRKREIMAIIEACIEAKRPELELRIPLRNTTRPNVQC
ncbi:unnamed protein product [Peronospora destructor]|uniref:PAS domain-containing protein n=1 Tax=Peronospora destructor TaxID=86335 RepID=A0AAV0SWJ6_9STRA|nr:unnamed protein product [Peronospora destructor]